MEQVKKALRWLRFCKPVRTAAQTMLAVVSTNAVDLTDVDWVGALSASALAAVLTILLALADGSSLSGDPEVEPRK